MALSPTSSRSSSSGGSIAVTDGVTTVTPATTLDFTAGVTVSNAGGGQANAAVTGGTPSFTPTATKTANYSANAGEWVAVDASGGNFTVTLPAAPPNGTLVAVAQPASTAGTVTVAAGAGDTIGSGLQTSITNTRRAFIYTYRASDKVWQGVTPLSSAVLTATAFDGSIVAGGTSTAVTFKTGTLDAVATAQPPAAAVPMNAQKITGLAIATAGTDAASLANTLDQFGAPAANVPWNAKKITGLAAGVSATDAAAVGEGAYLAILASGRYTCLTPDSAGFTGGGLPLNTMLLRPFSINYPVTVDRIAINVNSTVATAVVRLGIYADSNGSPGALILDAGTVDCHTATGLVQATVSQLLNPGVYWIAAVAQTAAANVFQTRSGVQACTSIASGASATTTGQASVGVTGVSGALPNPAGAIADGNGNFMVAVAVRIT